MNGNVVLRKTVKGLDEIKTREWNLERQSRIVLIMVNGELSSNDLHHKLDNMNSLESAARVDEILQRLVKQKFVTSANKAANKAANKDVDTIGTDFGEQRWSEHRILKVKDKLSSRAYSLLGKHADKITKKLYESANTMEGLAVAIDESKKFVKKFADKKLASKLFKTWQVSIQNEQQH